MLLGVNKSGQPEFIYIKLLLFSDIYIIVNGTNQGRDGGDLKELVHPENPNPQKRNLQRYKHIHLFFKKKMAFKY